MNRRFRLFPTPGPRGPQGPAGSGGGAPPGGTTNQVLTKASNADDDTVWAFTDFANIVGVLDPSQVPEGDLAIDWSQLTSVPATFPPSAHTHPASQVTPGTFAIGGAFTFPENLVVQGAFTQDDPALNFSVNAKNITLTTDTTGVITITAPGTGSGGITATLNNLDVVGDGYASLLFDDTIDIQAQGALSLFSNTSATLDATVGVTVTAPTISLAGGNLIGVLTGDFDFTVTGDVYLWGDGGSAGFETVTNNANIFAADDVDIAAGGTLDIATQANITMTSYGGFTGMDLNNGTIVLAATVNPGGALGPVTIQASTLRPWQDATVEFGTASFVWTRGHFTNVSLRGVQYVWPVADGAGQLTSDGVGNLSWASGGGAPTNAQYVTLATDATLTQERVLTPEASVLTLTDAGAGSTVTLGVAANGITDAKLRQSAGLSVLGRSANSLGNVADITAASDGQVFRRSGAAIGFGLVDLSLGVTGALATGTVPLSQVTAGTSGAGTFIFPTLAGTVRVTSPLIGTTTAVDVVFDRNSVTQLTLASLAATFAGTVSATQYTSTIATGTAPLVIASTTLVSNLTVENLGASGQNAAFFRDAGNLNAGTILSARVSGSYTGITGVGTLAAGAVPASLVTSGTFGAGAYTFQSTLLVTTELSTPSIDSGGATDLLLQRNNVTKLTLGNALATLVDAVTAPTYTTTSGGFLVNTTLGTSGLNFQDAGVNRIIQRLDSGADWSFLARDTSGNAIDAPWSLVIAAGGLSTFRRLTSFSQAVRVGTTSGASADVAVWVSNIASTAVSAYAVRADPTFPASTTTGGWAGYFRLQTAAAAFTMATGYGLYVPPPTIGAGSTITTGYGLYIDAAVWNGTTGYGLRIGNVTGAGTNYAIFTGTGLVQLGDAVTMTSTLAVTTSVTSPIFQTTTATDVILRRNSVTQLTLGSLAATFAGTAAATQFLAPIVDSNAASDLLLKRNTVTQLTLGSLVATFAGTVAATQFLGTIVDSNAASDLLLKRNAVTKVTIGSATTTLVGDIVIGTDPTGTHILRVGGIVEFLSTTANQLRVAYSTSQYVDFNITSVGALELLLTGTTFNLSLFAAGSYGGGKGVVFLANATTAPGSNPTGGVVVYSTAGELRARSTTGDYALTNAGTALTSPQVMARTLGC